MIKRRKGNYLMKVGSINATEEEKESDSPITVS
jgi:hypothetical protein